MALYETGTATDMDDLLSKLHTFCVTTNGFSTTDGISGNELDLNNGTVFVQLDHADAQDLALYQSTGYTTLDGPGGGTDDSGSGGTATSQRGMHLPSGETGPYTSYHFFTDNDTTPTYCHVVLEFTPGVYRHMSFGEIEKIGDWTGGSYAVGHEWAASPNNDNVLATTHSFLFEALATATPDRHGTIHMEGFPNQAASGKWGVIFGGTSAGTDTATNGREPVIGGFRDGFYMNAFGWIASNPANAFVNLVPIPLWYRDETPATPEVTLLGFAPNMRYVNIKNLEVATDYTVGSETWMVFPWVRKQFLKSNTDESWSAGVAYRKV